MRRLQWEIKTSLFRNGVAARLIIVSTIPFIAAAIYLFKRYDGQIKGTNGQYTLILLGILYFLILSLILALNIGKNPSGYILDEEGIVNYSSPSSKKSSRLSDFKLAFLGNPRRRYVSTHCDSTPLITKIHWKDIYKTKFYPKKRLILLCACFDEKLLVFCTEANYSKVEKFIKEQILLKKPITQEKTMEE